MRLLSHHGIGLRLVLITTIVMLGAVGTAHAAGPATAGGMSQAALAGVSQQAWDNGAPSAGSDIGTAAPDPGSSLQGAGTTSPLSGSTQSTSSESSSSSSSSSSSTDNSASGSQSSSQSSSQTGGSSSQSAGQPSPPTGGPAPPTGGPANGAGGNPPGSHATGSGSGDQSSSSSTRQPGVPTAPPTQPPTGSPVQGQTGQPAQGDQPVDVPPIQIPAVPVPPVNQGSPAPTDLGQSPPATGSNTTGQTIWQVQVSGCTWHCAATSQSQAATQQNTTVLATGGGLQLGSPTATGSPSTGSIQQVQIGCEMFCFGIAPSGFGAFDQQALDQLFAAFGFANPGSIVPVPGGVQNGAWQTSYQSQQGGDAQSQIATQTNVTIQSLGLSSIPAFLEPVVAPAVASVVQAVNQTTQVIAQLQVGCLFFCAQTTQLQQAQQSNTTILIVGSTDGLAGATAAGVADLTSQLIWQVQIGCLAWCWDTIQIQSAGNGSTVVVVPIPPPPSPTPADPPPPGATPPGQTPPGQTPTPAGPAPSTPAAPPANGSQPPAGSTQGPKPGSDAHDPPAGAAGTPHPSGGIKASSGGISGSVGKRGSVSGTWSVATTGSRGSSQWSSTSTSTGTIERLAPATPAAPAGGITGAAAQLPSFQLQAGSSAAVSTTTPSTATRQSATTTQSATSFPGWPALQAPESQGSDSPKPVAGPPGPQTGGVNEVALVAGVIGAIALCVLSALAVRRWFA